MIFSAALTVRCRVGDAGAVPTAGQGALSGVSVEGVHNGGRGSCFFPVSAEI